MKEEGGDIKHKLSMFKYFFHSLAGKCPNIWFSGVPLPVDDDLVGTEGPKHVAKGNEDSVLSINGSSDGRDASRWGC